MPTQPVGIAMDLVSRVKNILIDPQNEWRVIDAEQDQPIDILKNYVAIVAAIPAVCGFIGASIIGAAGFFPRLFLGVVGAVIHYVLTLLRGYFFAFILHVPAASLWRPTGIHNA